MDSMLKSKINTQLSIDVNLTGNDWSMATFKALQNLLNPLYTNLQLTIEYDVENNCWKTGEYNKNDGTYVCYRADLLEDVVSQLTIPHLTPDSE